MIDRNRERKRSKRILTSHMEKRQISRLKDYHVDYHVDYYIDYYNPKHPIKQPAI